MSDPQGALTGGLIGVVVVAVALIVIGTSPLALLPLAVAGVWLAVLLVGTRRR